MKEARIGSVEERMNLKRPWKVEVMKGLNSVLKDRKRAEESFRDLLRIFSLIGSVSRESWGVGVKMFNMVEFSSWER